MITADQLHARWQALPIGSLDDITGGGTCLILAPHPDDESLGCGRLIAACCAAARPPLVVILTDASGSHPGSRLYPPARLAAVRGGRPDVSDHLAAKRRAIAAHAAQFGMLITDDPRGFELPDLLLRVFDEPWETFLLP